MTATTETVSLIRDTQTSHLYFQVSQGNDNFYLCDGDGDKVELAEWSLVKEIGEISVDDSDDFFAAIQPYLAGSQFLSTWEAAGRPQVQEINYPRSGNATHHNLSHGDVIATAGMTCSMTFKDEAGFVSLEWDYDGEGVLTGARSSTNKLIFELPEA